MAMPDDIMNDAIVKGILNSLHEEGKVKRIEQETGWGGWRVTDREFNRRERRGVRRLFISRSFEEFN